ncbi:MAG: restriction endonuclease [Candidatus Thorarchaeota archaeon]
MADRAIPRRTIRRWLAEHARSQPVHYTKIAEDLERNPASVSASLSIEGKQALEDNRPAYYVRSGPGLYQYNDLCEGVVDEELITGVREKAELFNQVTRSEMRQEIAKLDLQGFEDLSKYILLNARVRVEKAEVVRRNENTVVLLASWRDDSGKSRVMIHIKKCDLDEPICVDVIEGIRGSLQTRQANQGVLVSNGVVTDAAKNTALGLEAGSKAVVQPVHLMDIEIILNVLLESRTGVRSKNVEVLLLDYDFFDQFSNEK